MVYSNQGITDPEGDNLKTCSPVHRRQSGIQQSRIIRKPVNL